jgi:hypothetical protein
MRLTNKTLMRSSARPTKPMKNAYMVFCACLVFPFLVWAQKPIPVLTPEKMLADAQLLKKIFEANHPSLYWYNTPAQLDSGFNALLNDLQSPLSEIKYRNRLSLWVNQIACGHTAVRFSKKTAKTINQTRLAGFPLSLKVWEDSLVVLNNYLGRLGPVQRGDIVLSINGVATNRLVDTLKQFVARDGQAYNHAYQVLSNNFSDWYKGVMGMDSHYTILYKDSTGLVKTAVLENRAGTPEAWKKQLDSIRRSQQSPTDSVRSPLVVSNRPSGTRLSTRQARLLSLRQLQIDTTRRAAYLRLTGFGKGNLKRFFRQSFATLQEHQIQHLIIDLRENGGGRVNLSTRLSRYLVQAPFKIGDSVVAISRKFTYGRYIHPAWVYWWAMNLAGSKDSNGLIHYKRYEQHRYAPFTKNHFSGQLYLLQGGQTFSAATMFIATLKGQHNVTVLGEETGGGYYGNSAMHIPTIRLPQTGLGVSLPLYRLVMDAHRPKGRGILPDVELPPVSWAIREGKDRKLLYAQQLIAEKKRGASAPLVNKEE